MSKLKWPLRVAFTLLFAACANCCLFAGKNIGIWICAGAVFMLVNVLTGFIDRTVPTIRLKFCNHGVETLVVFLASCVISMPVQIAILIQHQYDTGPAIISILLCVLAYFVLFWNGIISVYCSSVQLGLKLRVIGILCGMIPIANIIALVNIIRVCLSEVRFESELIHRNKDRASEQLCRTKYPILLVHGVFFRDRELLNYWGRIPGYLEENGAKIFYGNHQSALAIPDSARELTERIQEIIRRTGCEKVNVIAHSKGGLDTLYAIEHYGCGRYIASLTTVNTPHRGCEFADYLLDRIPEPIQKRVANAYNSAARKLGDKSPDFMAAVRNLTASSCKDMFGAMKQPENIFCQSVGSVIKHMSYGKFPTNVAHGLICHFEGQNDGLVSERSFKWSDNYTLLTVEGERGISHGDVIDLNRENIPGFDVREFYVQLVSDLKNRGL